MKKLLILAISFVLLPAFTLMSGSFDPEEYDDSALSNYSIFAIDNVKIYRNAIINSGDVGVLNRGMTDQLDSEEEDNGITDQLDSEEGENGMKNQVDSE